MKSFSDNVLNLVQSALDEDIGRGDLTSLACLEPDPFKGKIIAKSNGIISGLIPMLLAFEIVDSANKIIPKIEDGQPFKAGDLVIEIDGFNQTVLTAERTALNFLGHLSGIASMTNQFVQAVAHTKCKIIDTRKTTPGWRLLEKRAVVHGGGENHRIGLFDMILIKDNHIASAGSITKAVEQAHEFMASSDFRLQFDQKAEEIEIEVEVTSIAEATEAIACNVHRLLLDNQTTAELSELVSSSKTLNDKIKLEASGNMTLDRVAEVAETGVDYISVGALTHSACSSDFSLKAN